MNQPFEARFTQEQQKKKECFQKIFNAEKYEIGNQENLQSLFTLVNDDACTKSIYKTKYQIKHFYTSKLCKNLEVKFIKSVQFENILGKEEECIVNDYITFCELANIDCFGNLFGDSNFVCNKRSKKGNE